MDEEAVQQLSERIAAGQSNLTEPEKAMLEKELGSATATIRETPTVETKAYSGCWSKAAEATFYGGVTRQKMFTVGQTTKVCVSSGKVVSVSVPNKSLTLHGYPGIYSKGVTTSTNNVSWEGRGLAMGTVGLGTGGWEVSSRSQCVQMRLNADGSHHKSSTGCNL